MCVVGYIQLFLAMTKLVSLMLLLPQETKHALKSVAATSGLAIVPVLLLLRLGVLSIQNDHARRPCL